MIKGLSNGHFLIDLYSRNREKNSQKTSTKWLYKHRRRSDSYKQRSMNLEFEEYKVQRLQRAHKHYKNLGCKK
jgi:hypothetical protein